MSVIDVTFSNPLYLRILSLELATQPRRILAENRGKSAMPNPLNDAKKSGNASLFGEQFSKPHLV